jgi:signal transduction histidine kinase
MKPGILFIDDEPRVLRGLERMLHAEADAWRLEFVTSTASARNHLREEPFDAVVLDVSMPGQTGLEFLQELRSDERLNQIQAVILTGLQDQTLKRQALDLGATDLLTKPVSHEDLVARLRSALRIRAYHHELEARNTALEQAVVESHKMRLVGVLAAGVVHDLNNIMAVIVGYSDLTALLASNDPELLDTVGHIRGAGERARKILRQILDLSRRNQHALSECRLGDVVEECLELLRTSALKGVTIHWQKPETESTVLADATQMYQMLMNLCINAGQAMEGDGELTITVGDSLEGAAPMPGNGHGPSVCLEVSDTGPGMTQAVLDHLFEPLFTTRGDKGGSGIGLMVVQRIVQSHGGRITVDSRPGQGTTFRVYLPVTSLSPVGASGMTMPETMG